MIPNYVGNFNELPVGVVWANSWSSSSSNYPVQAVGPCFRFKKDNSEQSIIWFSSNGTYTRFTIDNETWGNWTKIG